jgi:hypothetical protein
MTLFAENVPEHDGEAVRRVSDADILRALRECRLRITGHADAGEIAFHIGCEDRRPGVGETFREQLQGDGLACAGRTGDEAVAVAEAERQVSVRLVAFADEDFAGRVSGVGGL